MLNLNLVRTHTFFCGIMARERKAEEEDMPSHLCEVNNYGLMLLNRILKDCFDSIYSGHISYKKTRRFCSDCSANNTSLCVKNCDVSIYMEQLMTHLMLFESYYSYIKFIEPSQYAKNIFETDWTNENEPFDRIMNDRKKYYLSNSIRLLKISVLYKIDSSDDVIDRMAKNIFNADMKYLDDYYEKYPY